MKSNLNNPKVPETQNDDNNTAETFIQRLFAESRTFEQKVEALKLVCKFYPFKQEHQLKTEFLHFLAV